MTKDELEKKVLELESKCDRQTKDMLKVAEYRADLDKQNKKLQEKLNKANQKLHDVSLISSVFLDVSAEYEDVEVKDGFGMTSTQRVPIDTDIARLLHKIITISEDEDDRKQSRY